VKKYFLIGLLFFSSFVFSQTQNSEEKTNDVKVGLVLSGGGAKGLAHIGVLKVIEKAGVKIDYIGGTSMGAIVGSLYASGYSANQLDSIFNEIDFSKLIQDDIPRRAKTFYERDDSEKYALTLPFDKFEVSFPKGISKGQNLYNLLSKLTNHVSDIDDFNELPIPFFCIATNVETGKEVVLDKGYLPRAITASGAIPTIFSPVKINDSIYVDGGVVNNYPVDKVRKLGADYIIGVDVQDTLKTKEELKTAFDVFVQISNFNTIEDMIEKRKNTDLYIHPNIDNYNLVSFAEGREIIDAGIKEASIFKQQLEDLASKQSTSKKVKKDKEISLKTNESLFIKKVEIEGNKNYTRSYVLGKLKLKTPAKTSYQEFNEGVNNLSATGNFQSINYRFIHDENDAITVKFNVIESDSKMLLRIAAHYDDLYKSAALVNITRKQVFTNNDVASFDFIVGDNIRYNFNYYIDKGFYWSVGLNSSLTSFDKNVDVNFLFPEGLPVLNSQINEIDLNYSDLTNQVFVQTLFKRSYQIRLGAEHKWLKYYSNTVGLDENNNPQTVFENNNYISTFGTLRFDTFDNKFFPKKGFIFEGDFHLYLLTLDKDIDIKEFSIAKAKIGFAKSFLKKLTAVVSAEGGVKIGGSTNDSFDFFVGGYGFKETNNIMSLYGYDALSIRGDTFLKSTFTLDYEVIKDGHINIAANIANVGDRLFSSKEWIDRIDYTGYAIGLGLETFIGPVEIKYSFSPEIDEGEWHVSAGFRF